MLNNILTVKEYKKISEFNTGVILKFSEKELEYLGLNKKSIKAIKAIKALTAGNIQDSEKIVDSKSMNALIKRIMENNKLSYFVENFIVIYFDAKQNVIDYKITEGDFHQTGVHIHNIYRTALLVGASKIAVAHNHPTGDPDPSLLDIKITDTLCKGCETLSIKLIDHIIFTQSDRYVSLADFGYIGSNA
jgi:DNA repair protein RadC